MSAIAAGAVCGIILKIAIIAFLIYWCKKKSGIKLVRGVKPSDRSEDPNKYQGPTIVIGGGSCKKRELAEYEFKNREAESELHEVRTLRDPSQIVVGSSDCPIPKLLQSMQNATSFPIFNEKWSEFARNMGVPADSIKNTRQDLLVAKIILSDAMYWIIENWVARMGKAGTLKAFLDILVENDMIDCAENVTKDFHLEKYKPSS